MAAIENMTRVELNDYILAGICEIESAGFLKSGEELRDDIRAASGIAEITEVAYDTEDLLRQLRSK